MTRRAIAETRLASQIVQSYGRDAILGLIPPQPLAWIVRGPRGGRYFAGLDRTRTIGRSIDDLVRDTYTVRDTSARTYYIRPGSRLERQLAAGEIPPLP